MSRVVVRSFVLSLLVHGAAWACSCMPDGRTADEVLDDYSLVAWGTVRAPAEADHPPGGCGGRAAAPPPPNAHALFRLAVDEGFVGAVAGEVVPFEASQGSTCANRPRIGERWLVLTSDREPVSQCNPSHPAEDDDELLAELRAAASEP